MNRIAKNTARLFSKGLRTAFPALLFSVSFPALADSPPSFEFRDLDGNARTVEAIYDPSNNLTWLADTNLGLSQTFGIERGDLSDYYSQRISEEGLMTQDTALVYIYMMNASNYLGYGQWRLPQYSGAPDATCSEQSNNGQVVFGVGCTGTEVGSFNRDVISNSSSAAFLENLDGQTRWVGSIGPSGGLYYYQFGGAGRLGFCPGGDGICETGFVWPVLDGSIGSPVDTSCIDDDGDGWGWNSYDACIVTASVAGECMDTLPLNDGWGWNGVASCQLPTAGEGFCQGYGDYPWGWNNTTQASCRLDGDEPQPTDCIDTVPLNDGWGWNGVESCQLPTVGRGFCQSYGDYPWGWNNTTKSSCRLDGAS